MIMSRTFTHKTDESTLTTLCPRCLNAFRNTRGIRVRRADPYQLTKEPCTYCQTSFGYDYYIQRAEAVICLGVVVVSFISSCT